MQESTSSFWMGKEQDISAALVFAHVGPFVTFVQVDSLGCFSVGGFVQHV